MRRAPEPPKGDKPERRLVGAVGVMGMVGAVGTMGAVGGVVAF